MMLSPGARTGLTLALCAGVLSIVLCARAALEARAEYAGAQQALARGDTSGAIRALRRAARWNAPGNLYAEDALAALARLATKLESQGQREDALAANRAIHAAIHASRGFTRRDQPQLEQADRRIAALLAQEAPAELDATLTSAQRQELYLGLLQGKGPRPLGVLFAFAGFATWVGAVAVFLLRGVDERGRVVRRVARRSGLVLLLGWIAFALGLRLA